MTQLLFTPQEELYAHFMRFLYKNNNLHDYYNIFSMIDVELKNSHNFYHDAELLIEWIDKNNNGILPIHIQELLNEFILSERL